MSAMQIKQNQADGKTVLEVSGKIDEDADFSRCNISTVSQLVLDLKNVETINSCGIREWIKWIRSAGSASQIAFRNCPKVIVDQINMVEGFLPDNATVESFFVPYYSEESGTEKSVLYTKGREFGPGKVNQHPEVKDDSGALLEMDVIEAKYFKFLEKIH